MQIENCVDGVQFMREKKVLSYPDWHAFVCAPNLPEACDLSKRVSQILRHQGPLIVNGGPCMRASVRKSGLCEAVISYRRTISRLSAKHSRSVSAKAMQRIVQP